MVVCDNAIGYVSVQQEETQDGGVWKVDYDRGVIHFIKVNPYIWIVSGIGSNNIGNNNAEESLNARLL